MYAYIYLDNSEFDKLGREPDEFVRIDVRIFRSLVAESEKRRSVHHDGCPPGPVVLVCHNMVLFNIPHGLVDANRRLILLRECEIVLKF